MPPPEKHGNGPADRKLAGLATFLNWPSNAETLISAASSIEFFEMLRRARGVKEKLSS